MIDRITVSKEKHKAFQKEGMVWMDEGWCKEFWKKLISIVLVLLAGYGYYLVDRYNNMRFAEIKPAIFNFPIDQ